MGTDNKKFTGESKQEKSTLMGVLSFTMDKVKELADANSVLGEKIVIGDTTIIPVSKVSAGFAGGGADLVDAGRKKRQTPLGSGGNVTVTPLTFLVIDPDGVRTVNVNQSEKKNSTVADIITAVIDQVKSAKSEKKTEAENKK